MCGEAMGYSPWSLKSSSCVAIPGFHAQRSEQAVTEYLATGYEDPARSFFSGVSPVPPGTYLTLSIGREALSSPQPYWWPERVEPSVSDAHRSK